MITFVSTRADSPVAQELLEEYFAARAEAFPGGNYLTKFPDPEHFVPPAGDFVVVYSGESPIGCGGVRTYGEGPAGSRFELKHLFLRHTSRGLGVGRTLLEFLEARAIELGGREMVLDTHHTLTAAGELYARTGYERVDRYNENPNATRWYRKVLVDNTPA